MIFSIWSRKLTTSRVVWQRIMSMCSSPLTATTPTSLLMQSSSLPKTSALRTIKKSFLSMPHFVSEINIAMIALTENVGVIYSFLMGSKSE